MGKIMFKFFFSFFFILGGLSGKFVLRGTNISLVLVIAGFGILMSAIYSFATHVNQNEEEEEDIADIPNLSIPPEHIKRATELIEQGMEKETIFQTLRSEGLEGKEISDAYYDAYHIYLKKQELSN